MLGDLEVETNRKPDELNRTEPGLLVSRVCFQASSIGARCWGYKILAPHVQELWACQAI